LARYYQRVNVDDRKRGDWAQVLAWVFLVIKWQDSVSFYRAGQVGLYSCQLLTRNCDGETCLFLKMFIDALLLFFFF
jgi:hypothetical protein